MGVALGCTHYIHLQRAGWKHWGPPEVPETIPSCYVVHQAEKDIVEMSILKLESYISKRQSGGTIHLKVWQASLTKCMTLDWSLSYSACVHLLSTVAATVQFRAFTSEKTKFFEASTPLGTCWAFGWLYKIGMVLHIFQPHSHYGNILFYLIIGQKRSGTRGALRKHSPHCSAI